jgi:hypothetical protein
MSVDFDYLDLPLEGGCQCGGVRYRVTEKPKNIYVCHCSECRKQSSSAFGISVIVEASSFELVKGKPRVWFRVNDAGFKLNGYFCGDCGSRLWHQGEDVMESISVKGGSLDQPVDLTGVKHIWTGSALDGIPVPENSFISDPD